MHAETYEEQVESPFRPEEVFEEDDYVPIENQCSECGSRAFSGCGCCGSNLCGMHEEVQAGFCSDFSDHELEGEIVYTNPVKDIKREEITLEEPVELTGCLKGEHFIKFPSQDEISEALEEDSNG